MRRASGHGIFLSLILNMVFRFEWLFVIAILIALHFILGWPLWLFVIPLACWILHSLIITLVLGFANTSSSEPAKKSENRNPYSKKNTDYYSK